MNSIWLSLLWKEWREYRWKLAALTISVLLIVFVSMLMAMEGHRERSSWLTIDSFLTVYPSFMLAYGFLAGFFLSMSVTAKENGNGTAAFLHSLPNEGWKCGSAKLLMASLSAILPIAVGTVIAYFFIRTHFYSTTEFEYFFLPKVPELSSDREETLYLLHSSLSAIFFVLSILWWSSAIGANQADEIRAGAIAFLGMLSAWLLYSLSFYVADRFNLDVESLFSKLFAFGPAGPVFLFESNHPGRTSAFSSLGACTSPLLILGHLTAIVWFLYRFGKWKPGGTSKGEAATALTTSEAQLKPPFASPFKAIAWKQIFETAPLALFGLAGAVALSLAGYWIDEFNRNKFTEIFIPVTGILSFLVVMVAGIGLVLEELRPGISDFWRSRPMDLRLWFATKYCTGITVLILFLGVPVILAGLYLLPEGDDLIKRDHLLMASIIAWVYIMVYSLTMLYQCLLRQPIYAAILALGTFWVGAILTSWIDRFTDFHWSVWLLAMIAVWVGTILLTWKAVFHNWSWK